MPTLDYDTATALSLQFSKLTSSCLLKVTFIRRNLYRVKVTSLTTKLVKVLLSFHKCLLISLPPHVSDARCDCENVVANKGTN